MIKKRKRSPVVAQSEMLHVSVKACPQQKISWSQLLRNRFPLLNISKVTDLLLCRKDFSLSATVGTCTSLKNFLPYSNHLAYWHLRFFQTFVLGLNQNRCLKFSSPNTADEIPPIQQTPAAWGKGSSISYYLRRSTTATSVWSNMQVGYSLRRHPDGLERCQGLHITLAS